MGSAIFFFAFFFVFGLIWLSTKDNVAEREPRDEILSKSFSWKKQEKPAIMSGASVSCENLFWVIF